MKIIKLILTIIAISVAQVQAATLIWNSATNDPSPATGFKVYRLTGLEWAHVGGSPTTNYVLDAASTVPGTKLRVTGTNEWGESLPSNEVTVPGPPQPPVNIIIRAGLDSAPTPEGPWTERLAMVYESPVTSTSQFFRTRLTFAR